VPQYVQLIPYPSFIPLIQSFTELSRTTLGSANATIAVTNLANKKWIIILCDLRMTASLTPWLRINNTSTGTPYTYRSSANGAADATSTSQNQIVISNASSTPQFIVIFIENVSTQEKLIQAWSIDQNTAGSGTAPNRWETVAKWADTANAINEIDLVASTSTFASGSEVVVLGADPNDSIINPFFNELGRGIISSPNAVVSSGTVIAKKYLMTSFYTYGLSANTSDFMQFNNDDAGNYCARWSVDSAADITSVTRVSGVGDNSNNTTPRLEIIFTLDISTNEKLSIHFSVNQNASGAATAPSRTEGVFKWATTSSQITSVRMNTRTATTYNTNSEIIVYGSD